MAASQPSRYHGCLCKQGVIGKANESPTKRLVHTSDSPPETMEQPSPKCPHLLPKKSLANLLRRTHPLDFVLSESTDALTAKPVAAGFISLAEQPIGNGSIQEKVSRMVAK